MAEHYEGPQAPHHQAQEPIEVAFDKKIIYHNKDAAERPKTIKNEEIAFWFPVHYAGCTFTIKKLEPPPPVDYQLFTVTDGKLGQNATAEYTITHQPTATDVNNTTPHFMLFKTGSKPPDVVRFELRRPSAPSCSIKCHTISYSRRKEEGAAWSYQGHHQLVKRCITNRYTRRYG